MSVVRWRKKPVEFDAVQWTGDNLEEMQEFVGLRPAYEGELVLGFTEIGMYLSDLENPNATAELWVAANNRILPIETGEWVIKDSLGFYPCKDEIIKQNNHRVVS